MPRTKAARNDALAREYRQGNVTMAELAKRHGIAMSRVQRILKAQGALLSPEQIKERRMRGVRAFWADAERSAATRRRFAALAAENRPATVWPDCPPDLRSDYETLRQIYPARVAKAKVLESAA